ncbi:hypothetical protein MKW92_045297 [Papaver armeniacum]|nr:hypothetical protein MKW92_045297 [Papaver armeniacum]
MRSKYECLWEGLPYEAMVAVVCFDVGLTTLSKAAMDKGMSHFVFVVYSNALATLILLPSSFIFHRTKTHPLTLSLLCRFFTLALIGITLLQNSVFTGINYSSPTLGSALNNLTPAFTFILAATVKTYPAEMIIVSFNSFFATIQCLVVSLIAEKNPNVWRLTPNLELVAILYSAFFGGVVTSTLQTWCLRKKGPVFVAMFTPVGIVVAAIMGVIFLGDTLHLGSLVGAAIIVLGFYGVIWGQSKEARGNDNEVKVNNVDDRVRPPSAENVPLLRNFREA